MSPAILSAVALFGFVTSITPGPNNMMLLASGLNFGLRRTVPHMLGISFGYVVMMIAVGLGLGELFRAVPSTFTALKIAGAVYMLWLAWKIAISAPDEPRAVSQPSTVPKPMTFMGAAAFQWVNPKAWVIMVTAIATYTAPERFTRDLLLITLICGLINLPSVGAWAWFGAAMRRVLKNPASRRLFNFVMAALLVASLWPLLVAGM